eukprot:1977456-Alexandrium_andersonii.AAC.1
MSASLVGSEMCIRDSALAVSSPLPHSFQSAVSAGGRSPARVDLSACRGCLLYTSDAADDM